MFIARRHTILILDKDVISHMNSKWAALMGSQYRTHNNSVCLAHMGHIWAAHVGPIWPTYGTHTHPGCIAHMGPIWTVHKRPTLATVCDPCRTHMGLLSDLNLVFTCQYICRCLLKQSVIRQLQYTSAEHTWRCSHPHKLNNK